MTKSEDDLRAKRLDFRHTSVKVIEIRWLPPLMKSSRLMMLSALR
jgi:hypothetical protein